MLNECLNLIGDGAFIKEKPKATDVCNWHQEDEGCDCWTGDCGIQFCLNEGTPKENNMNFCCGCGKKLIEHEWQDEIE